jgi:hypothetical protein
VALGQCWEEELGGRTLFNTLSSTRVTLETLLGPRLRQSSPNHSDQALTDQHWGRIWCRTQPGTGGTCLASLGPRESGRPLGRKCWETNWWGTQFNTGSDAQRDSRPLYLKVLLGELGTETLHHSDRRRCRTSSRRCARCETRGPRWGRWLGITLGEALE